MKTAEFGTRSGLKVTPISMGCMRFPSDTIEAVEMIRYAIDRGYCYLDGCRSYNDCEWPIARALEDGYREKVILSTKWSPWIQMVTDKDVPDADCTRRRIDESLMRLGVDKVDFYQVWNIDNREHWDQAVRKGGMVEGILKAKDEGLLDHIGFTSHEKPPELVKYLEQADWCEILLVSFNFLDQGYASVLEKAKELGIGTIVMNPVGGGRFVGDSRVFTKLLEEVGASSIGDLAVRYIISHPHIDTMLNGITCKEDVDITMGSVAKPSFTPEQMKHITEFARTLFRENVHFCTTCMYCQPCPKGIHIPRIMTSLYEHDVLGLDRAAKRTWANKGGTDPKECDNCGVCIKKCTQKLAVPEELARAIKIFES